MESTHTRLTVDVFTHDVAELSEVAEEVGKAVKFYLDNIGTALVDNSIIRVTVDDKEVYPTCQ